MNLLHSFYTRPALTLLFAFSLTLPLAACSGSSSDGDDTGGAGGKGSGGKGGSGGGTGGASGGAGGSATGGSGTGGSGGAATGGTGGASSSGGSGGSTSGGTNGGGGAPTAANCEDTPEAAPAATWVNATGNLAGLASECGNLGLVSAKPCSKTVIAGVAQKGLWFTEDAGATWSQLGSGNGSAVITNRVQAIVYDPEHLETFWEAGIYNGGGVYKTTDNGTTFAQLGSISHNDSVSVDLNDPDRMTLLAGPHETNSKMSRSTDGGSTWTDIGGGLPGGAGFCTASQVINSTTYLVGCAGGGVYRTTDSGTGWANIGTKGVVPQPVWAQDGNVYWPGAGGSVSKGPPEGPFTEVANGKAAGLVAPATLAELPDGRVVAVGADHLQITADNGATWNPIGDALPITGGGYGGASGVTYSALTKTFYIWRWDCGASVPTDGIWSAGFDYETQ